jgi:DNA (cytosine-5)-methyltransferase 1
MLENVRNLTAHDNGNTFRVIIEHLKALGYHVHAKVLNALDYGVPQKRERIIICGFLDNVDFSFPRPIPDHKKIKLTDILEPDGELDKKLWVRNEIKKSRVKRMKTEPERPFVTHENVGGSVTPHHFSCALRAGASANYILINNERRPSARELLRLQGFPDTFKIVVPYGSIKKQTGNSVAVPVIKAVAKEMISALKSNKMMETETVKFIKRQRISGVQ